MSKKYMRATTGRTVGQHQNQTNFRRDWPDGVVEDLDREARLDRQADRWRWASIVLLTVVTASLLFYFKGVRAGCIFISLVIPIGGGLMWGLLRFANTTPPDTEEVSLLDCTTSHLPPPPANFENKCDTCRQDFATCTPTRTIFACEEFNCLHTHEADAVIKCSGYVPR